MKLKVVFLFLGLALGSISHAQIKIGTNPENINAASVLELESTSRTLVLTRVNSTEMNIIRPLQGALVYNTETKCVHYYDGDQWLNICDALTNSVNISMVDNGDGSYTFTDANGIETIITTTTNSTFEVANGSLVLTDTNNNALSVALDSLNRHTYSSDAVVNLPASDSTIVITKTANNYNFEVGEITGLNILDRSITREDIAGTAINGDFHIQNRSTPVLKLVPGTNSQLLQTQTVTGQPTVVWVNKAGLFTAAEVSYNPVDSGLAALDVKAAIDELVLNSTDNQNLTGTPLNGANQLQIDIENGTSATVDLSSLEESADIAAVQTNLDNHIVADGDLNNTNESLTAAVLTGTDLVITESGVNTNVALGSFATDIELSDAISASEALDNDTDDTNESLTAAVLTGTDLVITESGVNTDVALGSFATDIELSDAISASETLDNDTDDTNESLTAAVLTGTDLVITESGVNTNVALGSFATDIELSDAISASEALDNDTDDTNESLTAAVLTGTDLVITESGVNTNVALGSFATDIELSDAISASETLDNDTDDTNESLTAAVLTGTDLVITESGVNTNVALGSFATDIELSDAISASEALDNDTDDTNESLTAAVLTGTDLVITESGVNTNVALGSFATDIELSDAISASEALDNDTNDTNESLTAAVLTGTDLVITESGVNTNVALGSFATDIELSDAISASEALDNDTDDTNESLTAAVLTGTDLVITESGVNTNVALGSFATDIELSDAISASEALDNDTDDTNESLTAAVLTGTDLVITESGVNTNIALGSFATDIELSDAISASEALDNDTDDTNEIQDLSITGTALSITNNATPTIIDIASPEPWRNTDGTPAINTSTSINYPNGNIGVGIATPTSTLHIGGSFATAISTITADTSLDASNFTLLIGADLEIDLPDPTSCRGRIYIIKNPATTPPTPDFVVTLAIGDEYLDSFGNTKTSFDAGVTQIQSDGFEWQQIN